MLDGSSLPHGYPQVVKAKKKRKGSSEAVKAEEELAGGGGGGGEEDDAEAPKKPGRRSTHVLYHAEGQPAPHVVGLHPLTANLIAAPLVQLGLLLPDGAPPIDSVGTEVRPIMSTSSALY